MPITWSEKDHQRRRVLRQKILGGGKVTRAEILEGHNLERKKKAYDEAVHANAGYNETDDEGNAI